MNKLTTIQKNRLIAGAPDLLFACQHIIRLSNDPFFVEAFNMYRQALPIMKKAVEKATTKANRKIS